MIPCWRLTYVAADRYVRAVLAKGCHGGRLNSPQSASHGHRKVMQKLIIASVYSPKKPTI